MDSALLPDDHQVTLTWTTTAIDEHTRTFTLSELREAVGAARDKLGDPHHPDITEDLHLLSESWLADYEDDGGSLIEFTRQITEHTDIGLPLLPVFTVTIAGPERHDGEKPYTYVLHAPDLDAARTLALAHHIAEQELGLDWATGQQQEPDAIVVEGQWDTFPAAPSWPADLPGRAWNDLRDQQDLLQRAYAMAGAR
jgi:hypothetical protein